MTKYDVSLIVPGIRPGNWESLYSSMQKSCNRHTFEIIFIGPHHPPKQLRKKSNVKYIEDFGCPTRCSQKATIESEGKLYALGADDGEFIPDAFSLSIDKYNSVCSYKDVIIQKYTEGKNKTGKSLPAEKYFANRYKTSSSPFLPADYMFAMNPLVSMDYYKELGGFDCRFEFMSFASHDWSYRAQRNGSKFYISDCEVLKVDHSPGISGDHAPVHYAHTDNDVPLYKKIYGDQEVINRIFIDFDNWENSSDVWTRRWPKGKP